MKRIAVYLTICHIAFSCGVAASSLWNWKRTPVKTRQIRIVSQYPTITPPPAIPFIPPPPVAPHREVVFGGGQLRIVNHQVQLMSEQLRYKVDVNYPEIVGTNKAHIENLNRHLKKLATDQYKWPMTPSQADLRYYKERHPEVFNSVYLDYEVRLATDSLLSIYFNGDSYGIGAAHSVQYGFTVNYDFDLRKELKLSDIFKRDSKYLNFIAHYCSDELSKRPTGRYLFNDAFSPTAGNFESWNLTAEGINFNFDACKVAACAAGEQEVQIPFTLLEPWLNPYALSSLAM